MNILTFDIEEWWVYEHYSLGEKRDFIPRLDMYLGRILDLLDEKKTQATFFCLGQMAESYPDIVKKIAYRGHHIGCHSYSHKFLSNLSEKQVFEDTKSGVGILENLTGEKITAYRAPAFSVSEKNKYVFDALIDNGILYDCSIFPTDRNYGGFPAFEHSNPVIIKSNGRLIKEFPLSTTRLLGKELAYSGGGYFRLFPYWLTKSIIKREDYVMTYFHIKDFDKLQKRTYRSFEGEAALSRYFKKYYGLKSSFSKFSQLVNEFEFINLVQADKLINWDTVPVVNL